MNTPSPLEAIFFAALEKGTPEERAAYLDEACGGDPDLRRCVDKMLAAQGRADSFLEQPAQPLPSPSWGDGPGVRGEGTVDQPLAELSGTMIGPYKLLEQIGEGGFGVVYMAEQIEPVRRKVALKILKPGMDTKQVVARFEAERQALAIMDHPNIAKVFDGGATGEPSRVSDRVEDGATRRLTPLGSPRPYFVMELVKGVPITEFCDQNHLTPRQRLELFIPVCQAVQHAHQKGIIHRDLKPSNVLVSRHDSTPVPKIIDFGIAKALGQELTDKTLFTGIAQMVGTPLYMSPEQAGMSDLDIDTRSDIYSLGVLLYELLTGTTPFDRERFKQAAYDEIRRIIREEEPPKPSTRLSNLSSPHAPREEPGHVTRSVTATLAAVAAQRQTEPAKLTKLVRGELDWIVMKALEKDRNRRYETANGFAADVQRYLADEAVQACPPSAGYRLRKFVRRNKVAIAFAGLFLLVLLTLTGGFGWNLSARAARQSRVAAQVDLILVDVDRLERDQKWPEALAAARRAEAAASGGEADAATAERVRELLKELEFIERLEQIRMQRATSVDGKFDDAGADRDYARAFRDYGVDVEELAVETSVERLKSRPTLAVPLGASLDDWVIARRKVSEQDAAGWKRLVAVARGIDPEPLRDRLRSTWGQPAAEVQDQLRRLAESIDVRAQPPATLDTLAYTLWRAKHSESAVRLLRDAQCVYPGDFWLNFHLANELHNQNDYEGAIRFSTAAVSIRPNSAAAHNNLSDSLRKQKKFDEAINICRKAIELFPKSAWAYNSLGNALYDLKKLDEAIGHYKNAIEIDSRFALAHTNLGVALYDQKKLDEAIGCHKKAIELDSGYAAAHTNLGNALCDKGHLDDAIACHRKAIELDPESAIAHNNLGWVLQKKGRLDEAIDCYRKAIEVDPKASKAHINLGNLYWKQDKWPEAEAVYREVTRLKDSSGNRYSLGYALFRQGKLAEAVAEYRESLRLNPKGVKAHHHLGEALMGLGDPNRAVEAAKKAVELAPQDSEVWQLLGWAHYRAGDWKSSIAALEKSMSLQTNPKGGDPWQWFFLAMAHWQVGNRDEARKWYGQAVQWMEKHHPKNEELRRFRAEAKELLMIEKKQ